MAYGCGAGASRRRVTVLPSTKRSTVTRNEWFAAHKAELRQCLRMTLAAVLTMALGELFGLPRGYWAVLTAVIVTQANVGGSIKATVDRLIGTLAGACYGGAVALLIPPETPLVAVAAVALALAPLTLASALSPSFRVAPITAIILLLTPASAQAGVLTSAVERIVEIGFGSVIGLVCSLTVLPAHASSLVAKQAASIARLYSDLLRAILTDRGGEAGDAMALLDRTRAALSKLETAVSEARHERTVYLAKANDPEPLLRTLMRIRHDLVMLRRATVQPLPPGEIADRLQPRLDVVAATAAQFLADAAMTLDDQAMPLTTSAAHAALSAYAEEVGHVRDAGWTRALPGDALERLFALGFTLDQLGRDFDDLAARAQEIAGTEPTSSIEA
jgi:uncharacterized membrane protein YccC